MSDLGTYVDVRTLRFERELEGTLEQVWSFLVEGEKLALWLSPGEIEPRIGGRVVIRHTESRPTRGVVTAWNPPRELAYTWADDSTNSEVSFELAETTGGVRLVLIHHRLPLGEEAEIGGGWHACLDALGLAVRGAEGAQIRAAWEGGQVPKGVYAHALTKAEAASGVPSAATYLREIFSASAFNRHMGFELVDISHERLSVRIETRPELIGGRGVLHGGAIAAAIDTLGAFHAAIAAQRHMEGSKEPTDDKRPFRIAALDHHVDYLRPLTTKSFMAASQVLNVGDNFVRVRAKVTSDEGELVAVASANFVY
jgi:uncharacterized protein (TIGR00369 family)